MASMTLVRAFYEQPTLTVAPQLLGKYLVRVQPEGITAGKIVETEAYVGPEDKASHASRGRTPRTAVMFGPAGVAYVYLIYGFHHCLNIVTEMEGYPAAVLIRAVEPAQGLELVHTRRRTHDARNLTNGPGKVCQAFAIDRSLNGADVCGEALFIEDRRESPPEILATPRVGVEYAGAWKEQLWRFYIRGHPAVSKPDPPRT